MLVINDSDSSMLSKSAMFHSFECYRALLAFLKSINKNLDL